MRSALEIHPVTGAVVDPQFTHSAPDRLYIPGIPRGEPIKALRNPRTRLTVGKSGEPSVEGFRTAYLVHLKSASHRKRLVNHRKQFKGMRRRGLLVG
jgi:hypothetical protein